MSTLEKQPNAVDVFTGTKTLEDKLKDLPETPGVYIMLDDEGAIIYIGKAKILKNRVRQYFHKSLKDVKTERLVEKIHDFRYIITESELDALALEATLVKKHQPQYNILLKDDKHRPYIRIASNNKYPALEIVRGVKNDGATYFGPYMFGINVKEIVEMLVCAFNLRTCSAPQFKSAKRACINFHIGRCSGACSGEVTEAQYKRQIELASSFLSGKSDVIKAELERKMELASAREEYETAIRFRNQLATLEKMHTKLTTHLPYDTDIDIFGFASLPEHAAISVTTIRGGRMTGLENFLVAASMSEGESLAGFMSQYYLKNPAPREVLVSHQPPDLEVLCEYLSREKRARVIVKQPMRGIKRDILNNTVKNAKDYLIKSIDKIKLKEEMTLGAIAQLKAQLGLRRLPRRIECFDISNISGVDKVASMTVAINGEKAPREYRKFKIKSVEGQDDYACMREVVKRRFLNLTEGDDSFSTPPDLVVIDGGKGQLSAAIAGMTEAGYSFDIVGLAEKQELIFLPDQPEPIALPLQSYALKCLIRVRDEAHRFAITYHRSLREKRLAPKSSTQKTKK